MDDKNHDRFVDELLDATLGRYSSADPRAGLEERVLATLRTSARPAPWLRWGWWPVLAASALVLLLVGVYALRRPVSTRPAAPPLARLAQPPAAPAETPAPVSPRARKAHPQAPPAPSSRVQVAVAERRAQLPSLVPLSQQEELFLRYVQETPREQMVATQRGGQALEAVRIEPVSIAPVTPREQPVATQRGGQALEGLRIEPVRIAPVTLSPTEVTPVRN